METVMTAGVCPTDRDVCMGTLEARLGKGIVVGAEVVVTGFVNTPEDSARMLGMTVEMLAEKPVLEVKGIDSGDPKGTFRVGKKDSDMTLWVYDVQKVDVAPVESQHDYTALRETQNERDEARRECREARAAHEVFADQVREVAIRVASDQGWCDSGLNDVLDELGLDRKENPEIRITATVSLTITARSTTKSFDDLENGFVRESIRGLGDIDLDGDWEDADVNYEIDDIEFEEVD